MNARQRGRHKGSYARGRLGATGRGTFVASGTTIPSSSFNSSWWRQSPNAAATSGAFTLDHLYQAANTTPRPSNAVSREQVGLSRLLFDRQQYMNFLYTMGNQWIDMPTTGGVIDGIGTPDQQ